METRTLTIKGVPVWLYDTLKQNAKSHRRSLNGEVLVNLEKIVEMQHPDEEIVLKAAAECREMVRKKFVLTEAALKKMKDRGRS